MATGLTTELQSEWSTLSSVTNSTGRADCPVISGLTISDHHCPTRSVVCSCGIHYVFFPSLLGAYEHIRYKQVKLKEADVDGVQ